MQNIISACSSVERKEAANNSLDAKGDVGGLRYHLFCSNTPRTIKRVTIHLILFHLVVYSLRRQKRDIAVGVWQYRRKVHISQRAKSQSLSTSFSLYARDESLEKSLHLRKICTYTHIHLPIESCNVIRSEMQWDNKFDWYTNDCSDANSDCLIVSIFTFSVIWETQIYTP